MDDTDPLARKVYSSLCHLTCGDREAADQLLVETYRSVPADGHDNASWLTFAAHQRALTHAISGTEVPEPLAFWASLSPPERGAIHLRMIERVAPADIASAFSLSEAEVSTLIAQGLRKCPPATTRTDLVRALQPTELWLGDDVRKRIHEQPATPRARFVKSRQNVKILAAAALAMAAFAAVLVANGTTSNPETSSSETRATTRATAGLAKTSAPITPTEFQLFTFGTDDTRAKFPIAPEIIVHYPNGKIGLSWTSPCDRPPIEALLSTSPDQTTSLQLSSGQTDIVSCAGMPQRWTAVIEAGRRLQDVSIFPVKPDGNIDPTYLANYFSDFVPQDQIVGTVEGYVTHASLVDADDQPWFYGAGCATPTVTRYESPAGPIFEVLSTEADQQSGSFSDDLTCQSLAERPELRTVDGLTFPRFGGQPTDRIDCRGPEGSFRDLRNIGADGVDKSTSIWTSWDGCLTRGDVIKEVRCGSSRERFLVVNVESARGTYRDIGTTFVGGATPQLPGDATDTGLRSGDEALWLSPLRPEELLITIGNDVHAWLRVDLPPGC